METDNWWIVVGGRRRIGRALAESLAEDHALILTSSGSWNDEGAWIARISKQTRTRLLTWDADSPALLQTMMADIEVLRGEGIRPTCAVLVAGTFPEAPLGTWDAASLESTWRMNLSFPMLAAQALAPWIREGGILQFVLDTALHRPILDRLPYSAAKGALGLLIPGLARALAPRIRVAGHAPGILLPDGDCDPDLLARRNLLQRNGEPGDLVRALRFAADSPYLTGEILTQDGGRRWA